MEGIMKENIVYYLSEYWKLLRYYYDNITPRQSMYITIFFVVIFMGAGAKGLADMIALFYIMNRVTPNE
jgi:hypothetical protein